MQTELVHCFRYVEEDGVLVDHGFDYMQSKESDKWDEELIALANKRERRKGGESHRTGTTGPSSMTGNEHASGARNVLEESNPARRSVPKS